MLVSVPGSGGYSSSSCDQQLLEQQIRELLLVDDSIASHARVAELARELMRQADPTSSTGESTTDSGNQPTRTESERALQQILKQQTNGQDMIQVVTAPPRTMQETLQRACESTPHEHRIDPLTLAQYGQYGPIVGGNRMRGNYLLSGSTGAGALVPSPPFLPSSLSSDPEAYSTVSRVNAQLDDLHVALRLFKRERITHIAEMRELITEATPPQVNSIGQYATTWAQPTRQLPTPQQQQQIDSYPFAPTNQFTPAYLPTHQPPSRASISVIHSPAASMRAGLTAPPAPAESYPPQPQHSQPGRSASSYPHSQAAQPSMTSDIDYSAPLHVNHWPRDDANYAATNNPPSLSSTLEQQLMQWQQQQQQQQQQQPQPSPSLPSSFPSHLLSSSSAPFPSSSFPSSLSLSLPRSAAAAATAGGATLTQSEWGQPARPNQQTQQPSHTTTPWETNNHAHDKTHLNQLTQSMRYTPTQTAPFASQSQLHHNATPTTNPLDFDRAQQIAMMQSQFYATRGIGGSVQ